MNEGYEAELSMNVEDLVKQLTVQEKAALVAGTNFMYTNPIPRLHVPSLRMSDGPHGLRVQQEGGDNGIGGSRRATAFPAAATTACGWNSENLYKIGRAMARECRHYGVNVLLGPAVNIKRNPLCGRNFEYFSEDPYLAGTLAAQLVLGLQSLGVGACVKHFALNNAENYRFFGDSIADIRAIREIYLSVFQRVVKAQPYAIMSAYNRVNGTFCSQNAFLLNDILRGEWGFEGAVMTDWGAMHERIPSLQAGLDLEMPGDTAICRKWILDGVQSGALAEDDLNKAVKNVLTLVEKCKQPAEPDQVDFAAHHALCAEVAADCAVLLKNDGTLPLSKDHKLCVVGELFEHMRYQGAGSSMINPAFLTSPKQAFDERSISYEYACGYDKNTVAVKKRYLRTALETCAPFEHVLVFAGLTDEVESEGADREHMRLPENQLALIEQLVCAGKKVTVVLFGGSPVELPFADGVCAILNMYLPGQNGGTAVANLLFGDRNPSGRLAESWAKRYDDVPFGSEYSKEGREIYKESVFVGYRYYATAQKEVRFPFGFGLSYTSFSWSDMQVTRDGETVCVSCNVKNQGGRDGAEVVQLYVAAPESGVFKPKRELRAFCKVYLRAGEERRVTLSFPQSDLAYWNIAQNRFVLEGGAYELQLCTDCEHVALSQTISIEGENVPSPYSGAVQIAYQTANLQAITDELFEEMSGLKIPALPPRKPITIESPFRDIRQSLLGRLLYSTVMIAPAIQRQKAKRLPKGAQRDNAVKGALFMKRVLETGTLSSMTMAAGKRLPYNFAEAFAHFGNGHFFKGMGCFCKKIKTTELPINEKNKEE